MSAWRVNKGGLVAQALAAATLMSLCLFLYAAAFKSGSYYFYLIWNLFLAALPLVFTWFLLQLLKKQSWSSWSGIGLSLLWLGFLPNSFYMITDYIHLQDVASSDLLFYVVLFTSFIITALMFGYASLYIVHSELRKRVPRATARRAILLILLVCSFAIYLGRDLRWNTWDVLFNPGGLLFDISERLLNPASYHAMFEITGLFTVLLTGFYFVIWRLIQAVAGGPTSVILEADERPVIPGRQRGRP